MGDSDRDSVAERYRELSRWGTEPFLNELDALMWRTEHHPESSWTGAVLEYLDRAPSWEDYRAWTERSLEVVPRFRQRVVDPLVPVGPPAWVDDEHFDIDYHLRRVCLPSPGSERQLLDLVERIALEPLDYGRPPWVKTFVEGLEGGRGAIVMQCHHVLTDGMGYAQLMSRLYDHERHPSHVDAEAPTRRGSVQRDPVSLALDHLARGASAAPARALGLVSTVTKAALAPEKTLRYLGSLSRVVAPPPSGAPLLEGGSRRRWRFGRFEVPLADFKRGGKAAGGSVNDAFVAALLGAIRRYHEAIGDAVEDVTISMPVSMRTEEDPMGGNRFTGAFFATSAALEDPRESIAAMRARVEQIRGEPALDFLNQLTPLLNRTPASVVGAFLHGMDEKADLTLSNWPGVPHPVYVCGAKVDGVFVFGPMPGTAMTASLNSHDGTCCIAINVDGDVFTEPETLWEAMEASFAEIAALARDGSSPSGSANGGSATATAKPTGAG